MYLYTNKMTLKQRQISKRKRNLSIKIKKGG